MLLAGGGSARLTRWLKTTSSSRISRPPTGTNCRSSRCRQSAQRTLAPLSGDYPMQLSYCDRPGWAPRASTQLPNTRIPGGEGDAMTRVWVCRGPSTEFALAGIRRNQRTFRPRSSRSKGRQETRRPARRGNGKKQYRSPSPAAITRRVNDLAWRRAGLQSAARQVAAN